VFSFRYQIASHVGREVEQLIVGEFGVVRCCCGFLLRLEKERGKNLDHSHLKRNSKGGKTDIRYDKAGGSGRKKCKQTASNLKAVIMGSRRGRKKEHLKTSEL